MFPGFLMGILLLVSAQATAESWQVVLSPSLSSDEAVRVALEDLKETGESHGLEFQVRNDTEPLTGNAILIGNASRNAQTARLRAEGTLTLQGAGDAQGYEIRTLRAGDARTVIVAGGSIIGDVYGLYWLWDRIRVYKCLPDVNVVRSPTMKLRVGAAWGRWGYGGRTKEEMRQALRQSMNWVAGPAILDLVPWNAEPEATENAKNREEARELIAYAHALHMKYLSFANEFTYHPSLLEECGASLSPCDPAFWNALQEKFRRLFEALPELDGIELCNDDISGFWDRYCAYDLMHENPECEWSFPKRFRTFVKKVQETVVGECGKTYFHFTWGLLPHEQHCQPAVFREIFTDEVPAENLYLMPKITTADRWWHQPYNPTFNQTPHKTIVLFETMNYYESSKSNLFPTFSGQYFQAGLQTFLTPENNNVVGAAALAGVPHDTWDTRSAYAYVLYRLLWDPDEPIERIARDFCAIHFGKDAAQPMADIFLLSPVAYKYGLHIEPVSYGQFNSFTHMRVGTFPAEGYPSIDHGREHLEFLRKIYLRCKPWKQETLDDIGHGLATAGKMNALYRDAKALLDDAQIAQEIEDRLNMTRLLIQVNQGYVETAFAYFDYMDHPTPPNRETLEQAYNRLANARTVFTAAPGFRYQLFGVDLVLERAKEALADVDAAKHALEEAPSRSQLEETVAAQQRRYAEVLEEHAGEAVKFAHFEAHIDGRDILVITGDTYRIKHLRWDGPEVKECRFLAPLPRGTVTVIPKDIQSRPIHPFVLEQPGEANDYTVRIYLDDLPGGKDWVICDLYYIPKAPEELGFKIPWRQ